MSIPSSASSPSPSSLLPAGEENLCTLASSEETEESDDSNNEIMDNRNTIDRDGNDEVDGHGEENVIGFREFIIIASGIRLGGLMVAGDEEEVKKYLETIKGYGPYDPLWQKLIKERLAFLHFAIEIPSAAMLNILVEQFGCSLEDNTIQDDLTLLQRAVGLSTRTDLDLSLKMEIIESILTVNKGKGKAQITDCGNIVRSPLHYAATKRFVEIFARLLHETEAKDLATKDKNGWTPLHHLLVPGNTEDAVKCIHIFMAACENKKADPETKKKIYKEIFVSKTTIAPQHLIRFAISNKCSQDALQALLYKISKNTEAWNSFTQVEDNLACLYENQYGNETLLSLLTDCIHFTKADEKGGEISYDFDLRCITNEELTSDQELTKHLQLVRYRNKDERNRLITHPIVQCFLKERWKKVRTLDVMNLGFESIILLTYLSVIWMNFAPIEENGGAANQPEFGYRALAHDWYYPKFHLGILLFLLMFALAIEIWQLSTRGCKKYWSSKVNWFQLLNITSALVICFWCLLSSKRPQFLAYASAVSGGLACYLVLREASKTSLEWNIWRKTLIKVLKRLSQLLVYFSPIFLAACILFRNFLPWVHQFMNPFHGLAKIVIYISGEYEYDKTFSQNYTGNDGENNNNEHVIRIRDSQLIFGAIVVIIFVLSIGLGLSNLITGAAVNDVAKLRRQARCKTLKMRLDYIVELEDLTRRKNEAQSKICEWFRFRLPGRSRPRSYTSVAVLDDGTELELSEIQPAGDEELNDSSENHVVVLVQDSTTENAPSRNDLNHSPAQPPPAKDTATSIIKIQPKQFNKWVARSPDKEKIIETVHNSSCSGNVMEVQPSSTKSSRPPQ